MADTIDNGNVATKNAETIKTGQSSAGAVKAASKKSKALLRYVLAGVAGFWLIFLFIPNLGKGEKDIASASVPAETQQSQSAVAVQPRVITKDFVIPAQGSITITKELLCAVDIHTAQQKMDLGIVRLDINDEIVYKSSNPSDIKERIWFFNEGGDCANDYNKLVSERAFK